MPAGAPTISVALCTFQGMRYLDRQWDSILAQTRLPDQVVVCDDGSTDGTREHLQALARSAPFPVELRFNQTNLGVTRNFDQALSLCAGEFAALSDQDDRWRTDKLAVLSQLLIDNPGCGYACSDAELIDAHDRFLGQRVWLEMRHNPLAVLPTGHESTATKLMQSNFILGATVMLNLKQLRPWISPIPASWYHDHWLVLISELLGHHGVATPEPLTHYRRHPGQSCGLRPHGLLGVIHKLMHGQKRRNRQVKRQTRLVDLIAHWERNILPRRPDMEKWRGPLTAAMEMYAEQSRSKQRGAWWPRWRKAA
jgi:glycosyltransferase involved in cell wall biosynthesis